MDPSPIDTAADRVLPSVAALLTGLVDYAGLFPPAKLDMPATVRNYGRFRESPESWMLQRLIVPVARLDEFEAAAAEHLPRGADDEPWRLSAITVPADDEKFAADVERLLAFNEAHAEPGAGLAVVDVIELKGTSRAALDAALTDLPEDFFPFIELPIADDPRGLIAALSGGDAGAKVRTGGVTADLYPEPAHVARFIGACAGADVPFKATAGLHHPLRHFSEAVGTKEFGFLNVFIAGALALHFELTDEELADVLVEESLDAFSFTEEGLAWRTHRLTTDEIEDARLALAISYGSCSFDEPRDDLRGLGLI
jgi:hypothetical protein